MSADTGTGERRIGDYRLLRIVGEGGMGVVHLAETVDDREVAVKVLRPHVVGDREGRERLAREVGTLQRVSSPRVAEVLDADPWGAVPYVVTRYVSGPPLHEYVRRQGTLDPDELRWFARGLAEALRDVHRAGVVHRDVKPANVLIEDGAPVLIDFGLARLAEDPGMTATGLLIGTPGYLAPEVIEGGSPTAASDVHSFAATVVFAATGRSPAGTGPSMAVMDRVRRGRLDLAGVPPSLLPLLTRCLDLDPRQRPSLGHVLDALTRVTGDDDAEPTLLIPMQRRLPDDPGPPDPTRVWADPKEAGPARPWRGRQRLLLGCLGVLSVVAVATAPYVAAAALLLLAGVLRFGSVTAERHARRQRLRGSARWYDVPATTLSSPAYLVVSLAGTLLLLCWSVATTAAVGLVALGFDVPLRPGLLVAAAVFVLGLWTGPGSFRVRSSAGRVTVPWVRGRTAVAVAIGLAALCLAAVLAATVGEAVWYPADGAPWSHGFRDMLRSLLP